MKAEQPDAAGDELLLQQVWEQAAGPIAVLNLEGQHVDINPAFARMLGYDRDTLLKLYPADVTHPEDGVLDRASIRDMVIGPRGSFAVEKRLIHADGTVIWVLINSSLVRDSDGDPRLVISQFHDITARRESELLWRRTLTNAPIGMALLDLNGHWTEVNDKLCTLVGYSRDELLAIRLTDLTYEDDNKPAEAVLDDLRKGYDDSGALELRFRHYDGHPFWMLIRLSVIPGADDRPAYLVSQFEMLGDDVRLSEARVSQLTYMALHDPLTGLANRSLLIDRFDHEFAELPEQTGVLVVMVADLDEFKRVNDRYGHAVGDRFLKTTAHELSHAVRSSGTVARTGGDEFVILTRVRDSAEAEALREQVSQRLNTQSVLAGDEQLAISASVGLTTTDDPTVSAHALIDSADRDMYARKGVQR